MSDWVEDDQDQEEGEDQKPTGDWRSAPDMQTFMEQYADGGGQVHDFESQRQQQQAVVDRDTRIQQAQERQQEFMQGEGLAELKGAKSLAEFMLKYQANGGIASDGWTLAEDATTGQLTVVEVD